MWSQIEEAILSHQPRPLGKQRYFAVLLPLVEVEGELHILYEVRGKNISQPGETSFPGGAVEKGETFEQAAVRETMEELNLRREQIRVIGEIDYIVSDFAVIHCFVGELMDVTVDEVRFNREVDKVFTVPVRYFQEHKPIYYASEVQYKHAKDFPFHLLPQGKSYKFRRGMHYIPFYELKENRLWGFTANLTDRFIEIVESRKSGSD